MQITNEKISTFEAAYRGVINKLILDGFSILDVLPINENRYIIVKCKPYNVLIMYKREVFFNFGKMFKDQGFKGVGDSINVEDLKTAIQREVQDIYSVFPNGHVYKISIQDFLLNSVKWLNKEGKEIRSMSIHLYKRVYEL